MLLRVCIVFLFLPLILQSSTLNIKEIQNDFYDTVILRPLYDKYRKKSLVDKALKERAKKFRIYNSYWEKAKKELYKKSEYLSSSQFLTLVDLSKQVLIVVLWDNEEKNFYPIGFDFISSGNIQREKDVTTGEAHYFKTPTGFFNIKSGWRSEGEIYKDKVTMPYGKKDSFVFYFGEQKSIRYNTFDKNDTKIKNPEKWTLITDKLKFAMHAHVSTAPLGIPQSHGCIRMTNELNIYLDNNLVFFKHLYDGKKWIHPYKKPPTRPKNHKLAGEFMLILNSVY
ncbi:MAG: L,D-transpeptidase [Sulfurimonas sp.]|jgi:lipoprotein-anchoring transpeptidase ErfK/SrfK|nr:L,D-transpeptidase [Sulfurimonas sp.]